MNKSVLRKTLMAALPIVAALALLTGNPSQAAKPGGGSVPPGQIYFGRYQLVDSPIQAYWDLVGYWDMLGDGSGKTAVPPYPYAGEPNRNRSANGSWILSVEPVEGTYPNGVGRSELFATDEASGNRIPLTDDAGVQKFTIRQAHRWAHDDSFISFAAVRWTPVETGGNFTDGSGQEWLVDAAVFVAELDWSTGSPSVGNPVAVLPAGIYWETAGAIGTYFRPDIVALDWSPTADRMVIEEITQDGGGGREFHDLYVVSFDLSGGISGSIPLGPEGSRIWSPDGGRIAYWRYDADGQNIWLVNPDGTAPAALTSGGTGGPDGNPFWSPDSQHLTFTRRFHNKRRGVSGPYTVTTSAVMRVPATGGTVVNLTKDLADSAAPTAWR